MFSENAMDCCCANQSNSSQSTEVFPNVSSPEMFYSDAENEVDNKHVDILSNDSTLAAISSQKPSQAELVAKADSYLLARINKYVSGVPPPPRHTICQSDCSDILQRIRENSQFFWTGYPLSNGNLESEENAKFTKQIAEFTNRNISHQCTKNLTNAFNTCDLSVNADSAQLGVNSSVNDNLNMYDVAEVLRNPSNVIEQTMRFSSNVDNSNVSQEQSPLLYHTIGEIEAAALPWPQAYSHKFHGIQ